MISSTNNLKCKTLIFFFILQQRLSLFLGGLNSSLAQSADELWPLAEMAKVTFVGLEFYPIFVFEL